MFGVNLASGIAGGVVGWVIRGKGKADASGITLNELMEQLRENKPVNYRRIQLNANTARENVPIDVSGDFLAVLSSPAAAQFTIRLNEERNEPLNLSRHRAISAPFFRLYVSNPAGAGNLELLAGQGFAVEPSEHGIEELAARIGSIVTFDRRGEVFWLDDFESGIVHWNPSTGGTGASVTTSSIRARNGAKSILLTAGSDSTAIARMIWDSPLLNATSLGFEHSFHNPDEVLTYQWDIQWDDDGTIYRAYARWLESAAEYQYENSAGVWTAFASGSALWGIPTGSRSWHTVKTVVDFDSKTWKRIIIDDIEYALTGEPLRTVPLSGKFVQCRIANTGPGSTNPKVYVDDVIVTRNEP